MTDAPHASDTDDRDDMPESHDDADPKRRVPQERPGVPGTLYTDAPGAFVDETDDPVPEPNEPA